MLLRAPLTPWSRGRSRKEFSHMGEQLIQEDISAIFLRQKRLAVGRSGGFSGRKADFFYGNSDPPTSLVISISRA